MAGRLVWLGGRHIAIVSSKAMQAAWFVVRTLNCILLLLKEYREGARCVKCTTTQNYGQLNHANITHRL